MERCSLLGTVAAFCLAWDFGFFFGQALVSVAPRFGPPMLVPFDSLEVAPANGSDTSEVVIAPGGQGNCYVAWLMVDCEHVIVVLLKITISPSSVSCDRSVHARKSCGHVATSHALQNGNVAIHATNARIAYHVAS